MHFLAKKKTQGIGLVYLFGVVKLFMPREREGGREKVACSGAVPTRVPVKACKWEGGSAKG